MHRVELISPRVFASCCLPYVLSSVCCLTRDSLAVFVPRSSWPLLSLQRLLSLALARRQVPADSVFLQIPQHDPITELLSRLSHLPQFPVASLLWLSLLTFPPPGL